MPDPMPPSDIQPPHDTERLMHELGPTFMGALQGYAAQTEQQEVNRQRPPLNRALMDSAHSCLWNYDDNKRLYVPGPVFENPTGVKRLAGFGEEVALSRLGGRDAETVLQRMAFSLTARFVQPVIDGAGTLHIGMPVDTMLGRFEQTGPIPLPDGDIPKTGRFDGLGTFDTPRGPRSFVPYTPHQELTDLKITTLPQTDPPVEVTGEKLDAYCNPEEELEIAEDGSLRKG